MRIRGFPPVETHGAACRSRYAQRAIEMGEREAHRRELETRSAEGCRLAEKFSRIYRNVYPRAWLLRGRLLHLQNKHDRARRALRRARDIGEEMQMPFERARAQLELARTSDGQEKRGLIESASATFETLGAAHYLRLAQTA